MNERVKFIARYLENEEPFAALCEDAEISRKTGYKWVERYEAGGVGALVDHSRWGGQAPRATSSGSSAAGDASMCWQSCARRLACTRAAPCTCIKMKTVWSSSAGG